MSVETEQIELLALMKHDIFRFLPYVRIAEPGVESIKFEPWSHLIQLLKSLRDDKYLWVLKSKQIGVSWTLALQALYDIYFTESANVLMLSKGDDAARELLSKSKFIYQHLPQWMQQYTLEPNSGEAFGFKELRSRIKTFASTLDAAVGETASRAIHDEADFHACFKENLTHTKATVEYAGQLVGVTTSDKTKPDSPFKDQYKLAQTADTGFKTMFFSCFVRPGQDEAWYNKERQRAIEAGLLWQFEGNYPRTEAEALSPLSAQSVFNEEALKILWENAETATEVRKGFIHIYQKPRVGWVYAAGADVGEGVGLDYSVLSIIGKYGGQSEVVAVIYSNEIATDLFAYEISQLCEEYGKISKQNPLLGVENNSIGVAVINKLLELNYNNLFYSDTKRQKAGWTTGDKNKQFANAELVPEINNGSLITRFKPQVKELMEQQYISGKAVPTGKTHGDTVVSLFIALQMAKKVGQKVEITIFDG